MAMRGLHLYVSDDGNSYRVLIPTWLATFAANKFGFAADDATKRFLPKGMTMRYINLKDAVSGRHRRVHCGTIACAGWTTLSTVSTLPNSDGTSTDYTSDGRVGEKLRGI